MNAAIKERWVAALRSGRYQQTRGWLFRTTPTDTAPAGFCCLGVLCELAVEDGVATAASGPGYVASDSGDEEYVETSLLPRHVMEWAGLTTRYGLNLGETTLSGLNDSGRSFDEIADIIEENA